MNLSKKASRIAVELQIMLLLRLFVALPFLLMIYFAIAVPIGFVLGLWAGVAMVVLTLGVINAKQEWKSMAFTAGGIISVIIVLGIIF